MKHVMLDIETLGTGPNATIIAIGAVKFDEDWIIDTFYATPQWSGDLDHSTIEWWLQQSREAIDRLNLGSKRLELKTVLADLNDFIGDACVWGNGVDFDNAIVIAACKREGVRHWSYKKNRCFRTIKNIFDPKGELYVKPGIAHDALEDAICQYEYLKALAKKNGIPL